MARVAVQDEEAAAALSKIKPLSPLPLIADVHFDPKLALLAIEGGADEVRVNPGTIRDPQDIRAIARLARDKRIPLRIGVNAGSIPPDFLPQKPLEVRMAELAARTVRMLEDMGFEDIEVSLKAFDVLPTVQANRMFATLFPYPLILGITESGLPRCGVIRSAVGIGTLLAEGIGEAVSVTLTTRDPREEVRAALEILRSLGLREGPVLVSCRACGRAEADIVELAEEVDRHLRNMKANIKVAVMGCVVNGPGEAREADVGLACGRGKGAIFRRGKIVRIVESSQYLEALLEEIRAEMEGRKAES